MAQPSPLFVLSGALKITDKITVSMEAVGNKIRLNFQWREDTRIIGDRPGRDRSGAQGQLHLLPEHRPAKFENIDTQGLHEAGTGRTTSNVTPVGKRRFVRW
jgi:hypothetical protein